MSLNLISNADFSLLSRTLLTSDFRQSAAIWFWQHSKGAFYLVAKNLSAGGLRPGLRSTFLRLLI